MALVVSGIRVPVDADKNDAIEIAIRKIGAPKSDIRNSYIVKTSVDARHRNSISLVYSVGIELESDEAELAKRLCNPQIIVRNPVSLSFTHGNELLNNRPVIVGFGPAGMFAGLFLSRMGYRPLIVERGADVDKRLEISGGFWHGGKLDVNTNVQFGEGGAGTFSDGKLTTRINDPRCELILREFVNFGAPEEITRVAKPHIGTDRLINIVKAIRLEIIKNGGEIRFETRLAGVRQAGSEIEAVFSDGSNAKTQALVLAIGHSARDTFDVLHNGGFALTPKPFSVGVRIEHLQHDIDKGLYGKFAGHPSLPQGEYQLSLRMGGKAVYTFCMCPGGTVVAAASETGGVVTNGMSCYARDGRNANSALVVSVDKDDFGDGWKDGIEFQRKLERAAYKAAGGGYRAPFCTVGALMGEKNHAAGLVEPSYPRGVSEACFDSILPERVISMMKTGIKAFDGKLPGFGSKAAVITGVETRTSSPVRILRDDMMQAVGIKGIYPAGEGAGYAGGIMSAAVDGLRVAEKIIEKYKPFE